MRHIRQVFEVVSVKAVRKWVDADGKKRQETRKFWQSINPFNTKDGAVKARDQILSEIRAERDAWLSAASESEQIAAAAGPKAQPNEQKEGPLEAPDGAASSDAKEQP